MAELATIARPYAQAVFKIASDQKKLGEWMTLLDELVIIVETPGFKPLALNPKVTPEQIVDLLLAALKEIKLTDDESKRLLYQLVSHRRLDAVPEIRKQFKVMWDKDEQVAEVTIYSAFPMSEQQVEELMPVLEKRFGIKLRPTVAMDQSLIGGICAVVGDDVLDLSVRSRLEKMKLTLAA